MRIPAKALKRPFSQTSNMEELLRIYSDIDKLKHQERKGWIRIGVSGKKDTIGSHTFGAALIGWMLSKREQVDTEKVIKLLLVHDLIMAHIPDYTPADKEYLSKKERESDAFSKLMINTPHDLKRDFRDLFEEYQGEETEEAILAREADKLDTLFQAYMYSKKLGENKLKEFLVTYRNKFRSKTGKSIFAELEKIKLK